MEWSMAPSSIVLVKQLLLCGGDGNSDWRERQGRRERQGQVSFPPLSSGGTGGGAVVARQNAGWQMIMRAVEVAMTAVVGGEGGDGGSSQKLTVAAMVQRGGMAVTVAAASDGR